MNMGLKIEGGQMEAGFTVSSREEFDECVAKLTTMAGTLWPNLETTEPESKPLSDEYASSVRALSSLAAAGWREAQGLR